MNSSDPTIQIDALLARIVAQNAAYETDVEELIRHIGRMREALAPFMFAEHEIRAMGQPFYIELGSLTISSEHMLAAARAYDRKEVKKFAKICVKCGQIDDGKHHVFACFMAEQHAWKESTWPAAT